MLAVFLILLKAFGPLLIIGLFYGLSANTKPKRLEESSGAIQVNRPTVIILTTIGLLITAPGAYLVSKGVINFLSLGTILSGTAFTFLCLPGLSDVYDVTWDETGVTGPSNQLPVSIKRHRTQMNWSEIIAVEENFLQNRYIKSTGNRKIFWNYIFDGSAEFERALYQNTGYRI